MLLETMLVGGALYLVVSSGGAATTMSRNVGKALGRLSVRARIMRGEGVAALSQLSNNALHQRGEDAEKWRATMQQIEKLRDDTRGITSFNVASLVQDIAASSAGGGSIQVGGISAPLYGSSSSHVHGVVHSATTHSSPAAGTSSSNSNVIAQTSPLTVSPRLHATVEPVDLVAEMLLQQWEQQRISQAAGAAPGAPSPEQTTNPQTQILR